MSEKRTNQQNKALHVFFRDSSDALNDAGLTIYKALFSRGFDTYSLIKEWEKHQDYQLLCPHETDLIESALDYGFQCALSKSSSMFEIAWTPELFKELVFKPMAKALFGVDSTTQLNTKQVGEVSLAIINHLAKSKGVGLEFPDVKRCPMSLY